MKTQTDINEQLALGVMAAYAVIGTAYEKGGSKLTQILLRQMALALITIDQGYRSTQEQILRAGERIAAKGKIETEGYKSFLKIRKLILEAVAHSSPSGPQ